MSFWKVIIWLVATLGIAGTITLFVLYPLIVGRVVKALIDMVTTELSYRLGCAITAAILAGFAVDYWRHSRDDAAFAARTAMFEHAQKLRDDKIAADTRQTVLAEIATEKAAQAATDTDEKEFSHDLRPLPATDTDCRVGPAVDKLRVISGQVDRKHRGPKGMPKAWRAGAGPQL